LMNGDYYVAMGDSITVGSGDDDHSDGYGYEPILDGLLTSGKGVSHIVANQGVSGDTAADGVAIVSQLISYHPDAEFFLILYGSNDAIASIPSGVGLNPGDSGYHGSYKENMEYIVSFLRNAGIKPYLSKVPYNAGQCPTCDPFLQEYNQVINELVSKYGIAVNPPNFYKHFKNNPGELIDKLHPNGAGYRSMAALWYDALK
ncbi:SGNH/GDSL hydrolase family protein, partial [candidate division CSSED10-310 bacterium]